MNQEEKAVTLQIKNVFFAHEASVEDDGTEVTVFINDGDYVVIETDAGNVIFSRDELKTLYAFAMDRLAARAAA